MEYPNTQKDAGEISSEGLKRSMNKRQIQMLALGGVIGIGLFYGGGQAVSLAGPSTIVDFVICGIIVAIVMRTLGEMTIEKPISGSFGDFAKEFLGARIGFVTSGMWWFFWVATVMSELAAIGKIVQVWFPDFPVWVPGFIALILFTLANLLSVKIFGEVEYWFAILKVLAIVVFMAFGALIILTGVFNHGQVVGLTNLWAHGGFMPNGLLGIAMAVSLVIQSYSGIETLAVTSGETNNPANNMRRAFGTVTFRIAILYIGSIFIMLCVFPWGELIHQTGSPYIQLFNRSGLPAAAVIMSVLIVFSGLSSCNTGLYGGSRMLFGSALKGGSSSWLTRLNHRKSPYVAVLVTAAAMAVGVLITYFAPNHVYVWITSASAFADIWTWGIILICELLFRKRANVKGTALQFPVPLWPAMPIIGLVLLVLTFVAIVVSPLTRVSVFSGIIWLAILLVYSLFTIKKDDQTLDDSKIASKTDSSSPEL